MAIKVSSNKSNKSPDVKSGKPIGKDMGGKENYSYEVEKITNGYIVTKRWNEKNKDGYTDYKSEKIYHEKNPIEA